MTAAGGLPVASAVGCGERAVLDRDGVLEWGQFLRPEELAPVRQALERAFCAGPDVAADVHDRSERRGRPPAYGLLQPVDLWQDDPVFAALVARPDVIWRVQALLGGPVRLFRDHALYRPAGTGEAGGPALHQDNRYWHLEPAEALTIWVALDDATVATGCEHYVPGSHRGDLRAVPVEAVTDAPPVPYPVPAGSALVHHARVLHGSLANRTGAARRAYCIVYMRADVLRRGEPLVDYPLATDLLDQA